MLSCFRRCQCQRQVAAPPPPAKTHRFQVVPCDRTPLSTFQSHASMINKTKHSLHNGKILLHVSKCIKRDHFRLKGGVILVLRHCLTTKLQKLKYLFSQSSPPATLRTFPKRKASVPEEPFFETVLL